MERIILKGFVCCAHWEPFEMESEADGEMGELVMLILLQPKIHKIINETIKAPSSHGFAFAALIKAPTGRTQRCHILHHKPSAGSLAQ